MTMMRNLKALGAALLICAVSATEARADGFVSPFWAVNFGGDAGGTFNNNVSDRNRTTFGAVVGFMSGGILGFELDLAYTIKFYGEGAVVGDNSQRLFTTASSRAAVSVRVPRPFASARGGPFDVTRGGTALTCRLASRGHVNAGQLRIR